MARIEVMVFLDVLRNDWRKLRSWLTPNDRFEWLLLFFITIFVLYFAIASFARYDQFYTGRFDLGNMAQTVWNTSQGRPFLVTEADGTGEITRLAYHADVILMSFAPFYLIWPSPKLLVLVQAIVVGLGAIFVYKIAHHTLHNRMASLMFGFSYLMYPALERSVLYDFHAVVLATTFLLGAFYFAKTRKYGWFLVFAVLAGFTKEQVWIIVAILGLFILIRGLYCFRVATNELRIRCKKEIVFGVATALVSFLLFYSLFWIVIPGAYGREHFATEFYGSFGDSPGGIIKGIVTQPKEVLAVLTEQSRISYLRQLLIPLGFLPLFSPLYLIFAIPDLTINLLSSNANLHQIYYQYTATVTPFLFIAAIFGVRLIRHFLPRTPMLFFIIFVPVAAVYGAYQYGPLPYAKSPNLAMFTEPRPEREAINTFLRTIPDEARVAASNQVASHLSNRRYIYVLPNGIDRAEYVLFLLSDNTSTPSRRAMHDLADSLMNNPGYIVLVQEGNFIAFKKASISLTNYQRL